MNVKYEVILLIIKFKRIEKAGTNNFKYLKVGPELTYYFTKAILLMSKIEDKYFKNTRK